MSSKPSKTQAEKLASLYPQARVRMLEDRVLHLEGNVARIGDYLSFIGEKFMEMDAKLNPIVVDEASVTSGYVQTEPLVSGEVVDNVEADAASDGPAQLELVK